MKGEWRLISRIKIYHQQAYNPLMGTVTGEKEEGKKKHLKKASR